MALRVISEIAKNGVVLTDLESAKSELYALVSDEGKDTIEQFKFDGRIISEEFVLSDGKLIHTRHFRDVESFGRYGNSEIFKNNKGSLISLGWTLTILSTEEV